MKITGNDELIKYFNDAAVNRADGEKSTRQAEYSAAPKSDAIVNLSQRAREVQLARQAIESAPDVRMERVEDIAKKVGNGTYTVDYDKTGEKMVAAFFEEKL